MWDAELDIIIAGAGGCGLVAALAAVEQASDIEVIIFEKTENVLGNTSLSAGMVPAAGTRFQREAGIIETYEDMAEDILIKNGYESDKDLTFAVCKESGPLVEWLVDSLGIEMSLVGEFKYPGQRNIRMHAPKSRSGLELINSLKQRVSEHDNIHLIKNSEVFGLITDEQNCVIGVEVNTLGTIKKFKAKKVILATNGFGANQQLVRKHIPEIADAIYLGYEGNTGDAIQLGESLEAGFSNLHGYQGHAAVTESHGILVSWGTMMMGGFMVNNKAERFGNECEGYSEFAEYVLKQPQKHGYIIFDQEIHDKLIPIDHFKNLVNLKAFESSNSMEELAEKINIEPSSLHKTFIDFIESAAIGKDRFGRDHFPKKLIPPYYGVKVVPALFHTQGGLNINTSAQVLNKHGNIITNLYAGGGAAVGVSGNHAYGYVSGNGLLAALGFGKIAGDHAALTLLSERSNKHETNLG
jgi:fumarate reductase flavoprotein subunit